MASLSVSLKRVQAFLEAEEARWSGTVRTIHTTCYCLITIRSAAQAQLLCASAPPWRAQVEPRELLAAPFSARNGRRDAGSAESDDVAAVEVSGGHFAWGEADESPALRGAALRVGSGELVCLVGQVGCGKSSLLHAILGELRPLRGSAARVRGDVAYCAQTAFIVNGTLEENILFGRPMDRELYRRVVFAAALEPDLKELVRAEENPEKNDPLAIVRNN